jgi:hypothetical protein
MILRFDGDDNLRGVDDWIAETSLNRRARQRRLADAPKPLCGRRFAHPPWPARLDTRGYLLVDTCVCIRPSSHEEGCVCEHDIERIVYRVDSDGREHYATRPHEGRTG